MTMTTLTTSDNAHGNTKGKRTWAYNGEGRSTLWFLTINNYSDAELNDLKNENVKYIIFQSEKGSKSGTHHVHATIRYKNAISFNSMKNKFPRAKIERVRNFTRAREYCCKDRTFTGIRYEKNGTHVIININDLIEDKEKWVWDENEFRKWAGDLFHDYYWKKFEEDFGYNPELTN